MQKRLVVLYNSYCSNLKMSRHIYGKIILESQQRHDTLIAYSLKVCKNQTVAYFPYWRLTFKLCERDVRKKSSSSLSDE